MDAVCNQYCNYFFTSQFLDLSGRVVDFKTFLINFTMFQKMGGYDDVDGAHWFIFTLLILSIWGIVIENSIKYKQLAYLAFIVLGLYFTSISKAVLLWQSRYASFMVFTIMVRYIIDSGKKVSLENIVNAAVAIVSLVIMTYNFSVLYIIYYLFTLIIVILCYAGKIKIESKFLIYIGTISYYIFLVHQNMSFMVMNTLCQWFGKYHLWYAFICLPIIWGLALLIQFLSNKIKNKTDLLVNKITQ